MRSQLHPVLCALPSSACVPCQWCPLSQGLMHTVHCSRMMWSGTQGVAGSVVSQERQERRMCFYRLEGDVRMYAPVFSAWLIKFIFRLFSGSILPCYLISEDTVDCPLLCSCTSGRCFLYLFLSPRKYSLPVIIWGSYSNAIFCSCITLNWKRNRTTWAPPLQLWFRIFRVGLGSVCTEKEYRRRRRRCVF